MPITTDKNIDTSFVSYNWESIHYINIMLEFRGRDYIISVNNNKKNIIFNLNYSQ